MNCNDLELAADRERVVRWWLNLATVLAALVVSSGFGMWCGWRLCDSQRTQGHMAFVERVRNESLWRARYWVKCDDESMDAAADRFRRSLASELRRHVNPGRWSEIAILLRTAADADVPAGGDVSFADKAFYAPEVYRFPNH